LWKSFLAFPSYVYLGKPFYRLLISSFTRRISSNVFLFGSWLLVLPSAEEEAAETGDVSWSPDRPVFPCCLSCCVSASGTEFLDVFVSSPSPVVLFLLTVSYVTILLPDDGSSTGSFLPSSSNRFLSSSSYTRSFSSSAAAASLCCNSLLLLLLLLYLLL
jgi:hypothetical protein